MIQPEEIKRKLDSISSSYKMTDNNSKVIISMDDFNYLVYGMDELLAEIEDDKKHVKMMAERIKELESKLLFL